MHTNLLYLFVVASLAAPFTGCADSTACPVDPATGQCIDSGGGGGADAVSACRLAFGPTPTVGVGFPTPDYRLRSTGTVRGIVLFAEFADGPADRTPDEMFALVSPHAEDWYDAMSYGQMDLQLEPHLQWYTLGGTQADYAQAITTFEGHRDMIQESVTLADDAVEFSGADFVVVLVPPSANQVGYGPAMSASFGSGVFADGTEFTNGTTSGADILAWDGLWLPHEMGHLLGLPDLYSFDEPIGFTRPFSMMDLISSEAPEFFAWERWQLGWLDDDQILCDPAADTEIVLSPVETSGGSKAAIVPISSTRVVVVESRRAMGYDAALPVEGAVVYTVDTTIGSGYGPIRVGNGQEAIPVGGSAVVDGVTVEVLDQDADGLTIRVAP